MMPEPIQSRFYGEDEPQWLKNQRRAYAKAGLKWKAKKKKGGIDLD